MKRFGLGGAALLLLLCALYSSLAYTFAVWGSGPSADSATTAMLWHGFEVHGLRFLRSWRYSQDNQLLSLMPLAGIAYFLFGVSAYTVVGIGWLVFVLNAMLVFVIARRFIGPYWALSLAFLVLSANLSTVGQVGFLGFSQTHNISFVWSLLGLYAATQIMDGGRPFWFALFFLAVTVGAVSDAWFNASLTVPVVVGAFILRRDPEAGRRARQVAIVALLAMVLASTKLLGLLAFVPSGHFHHARNLAEVARNAIWLGRILMVFFNIKAAQAVFPPVGAGLYALMMVSLFLMSARNFLKAWPSYLPGQRFVLLTALLSSAIMMLAFVVSSFPSGVNQSGRFLVNIFYFLPLLLALTLLPQPIKWVPALWAVWCIVFAGLSLSASPGALSWQGPRTGAVRGLAHFLREHRLFHGYGAYYDANANTVTWASHFKVRVRPLMFAGAPSARIRTAWQCPSCAALWVPNPNQDSEMWFRPQAARGSRRSFLVFAAAGLLCATAPACEKDAIRQFGPPSRRLKQGGFTILVFAHPLAPYIAESVERARVSWDTMNEARNRAAIGKVCRDLHWSCVGPQRLYGWLLAHGYAH